MKRLLLFFVSILFFGESFSQILISPKDTEASKQMLAQPLLVEIYSVDDKTFAKLNDDEKQSYQKWVEDYNELLKVSFKKYWKLHSDPIFLTYSQIEETIAKRDQEYAIFLHAPFEASSMSNNSDASSVPYTYSFNPTKKGKINSDPAVQFTVMMRAETEVDFRFILHNLGKYLMAESEGKTYKDESLYNKEENYKILTEKTLLFTSDMIDTVKYSKAEALKKYPHELKFVSIDEVYSAIENEDKNSLFLTYIINQSFNVWVYAIVDVSTMNIIEMQTPARVHFAIGRQFTTGAHARELANKYGGSPYSYKNPLLIWQARANIQLNSRDFSILGIKACVNSNYANPMMR